MNTERTDHLSPLTQLATLIVVFTLTQHATAMISLSILGLVDGKPAKISIDQACPSSSISGAFLYRNDMNPLLDSSGLNHQKVTLSTPSLGGYYTSSQLSLVYSVASGSDVVLGADWVSACRPLMCGNALTRPAPETVGNLPDGHTWTATGTSMCVGCRDCVDLFCRGISTFFALALESRPVPFCDGSSRVA